MSSSEAAPALRTRLGPLELAHPLVNGSGTLDALVAGTLGLAAFVTKTVTPEPRDGNPPPRIAETPSGMLNSIGLANPGLERFDAEVLPWLAELGAPLVVSVGGFSHDGYARCVARLTRRAAVTAIELNVSCPNVESGCISIGSDPAETRALVRTLSGLTDRPLLVKLTPNVADLAPIALAAAEGGAAGLVVTNTLRGIAIDRRTLRPLLGGSGGGLSGPALKPVALHCVGRAWEATGLPIVGSGGAASAEDCLEFLAAGAAAVALGTALFADPGLPSRILDGLPALMAAHGASCVGDLVGRAWRHNSQPLLEGDVRVR